MDETDKATRDYFCWELEELLKENRRDEDWVYITDKTTREVNMKLAFESPSEDFVNSCVLPVLQRARVELAKYHGKDSEHYLHNLDFRIAICRTYVSGKLVLPENASPEDIWDLEKVNGLFEMHRKVEKRFEELLGEFF